MKVGLPHLGGPRLTKSFHKPCCIVCIPCKKISRKVTFWRYWFTVSSRIKSYNCKIIAEPLQLRAEVTLCGTECSRHAQNNMITSAGNIVVNFHSVHFFLRRYYTHMAFCNLKSICVWFWPYFESFTTESTRWWQQPRQGANQNSRHFESRTQALSALSSRTNESLCTLYRHPPPSGKIAQANN